MEPQMPGLAACHGKILSPQNAINGTPRHHPYIPPASLQCVLQNGQRRAAKNGTYVKPGGGQRRKNS